MDQHRVLTSPSKSISTAAQLSSSGKNKFFSFPNEKKEEINEKVGEILKKCVRDWLENTTSHGFSNMIRTDSWIIRIVWLALVIVFMAYCIFTVVTIIMTYLKYEVVVSYKIVSDSPSPFPAITICNLNPFDVGTDEFTGTYMKNVIQQNSLHPNITLSENETAIVKVSEVAGILRAYATSDKSLSTDDLKLKGFTIDTMLISCFYNNEECSTKDFHWFRDNDYGNCYTFNDLFDGNNRKRDSLKTSKSGPENGLKMEIFVGVSGKQDFFLMKKGIKVVIHERGVIPILRYDGIEVSTGASTYVAISRTNYSKEPPPYSNCRSDPNTLLAGDSDYHKYTLSISRYYQKLCYEICLQYEEIIPNCDCADPSIPIVDRNLTICNSKEKLKCVKEQRDDFDSNKNIDQVCGQFCPNDCNQLIYSTSTSQSSYPTNYYGSILISQNNLIDKFNPANEFSPSNSPVNGRKKRAIPNRFQSSTHQSRNSVTTPTSNPISVDNSKSEMLNQSFSALLSNESIPTFINQTKKIQTTNSSTISSLEHSLSSLADKKSTKAPSTKKKPPSQSDVQLSVLMISLFYDELKYIYIEESPAMTLETMFGLIGGQLGLFMGASFLSFVEILEMIINIARAYFSYKSAKKAIKIKVNKNIQN